MQDLLLVQYLHPPANILDSTDEHTHVLSRSFFNMCQRGGNSAARSVLVVCVAAALGWWASGYRVHAGSPATSTQRRLFGHSSSDLFRKHKLPCVSEGREYLKKLPVKSQIFAAIFLAFIGRKLSLLVIYTPTPSQEVIEMKKCKSELLDSST